MIPRLSPLSLSSEFHPYVHHSCHPLYVRNDFLNLSGVALHQCVEITYQNIAKKKTFEMISVTGSSNTACIHTQYAHGCSFYNVPSNFFIPSSSTFPCFKIAEYICTVDVSCTSSTAFVRATVRLANSRRNSCFSLLE